MAEGIEQRAYEIVEELRADIDFELDDVIAGIVRGLPEDYFTSLSRQDQLTQLKALLAMGICNLKEEVMLRYDNRFKLSPRMLNKFKSAYCRDLAEYIYNRQRMHDRSVGCYSKYIVAALSSDIDVASRIRHDTGGALKGLHSLNDLGDHLRETHRVEEKYSRDND